MIDPKSTRLKFSASTFGRIGWHGLSTEDYATTGELLVTGTELVDGKVQWERCHRVSTEIWDRDPHIQLHAGDLLLTKDGTIGKVALVEELPGRATLNSGVFRIVPNRAVLAPRYGYWALNSKLFADFVDLLGSGSTINHLYQADVVNFGFPIPSLPAQQAIADYLDRETARIDSLIAARRKMAHLIVARTAASVESQIRTMALQYGDTPLKFACREVVVGIVVTPAAWYAESGVPAIRGTNVLPGHFDLTDLVYLTPEGHALHRKSTLLSGDVVVVRTGQTGAAAVVPGRLEGANCIDLVIVRPGKHLDPHFLEFVLNSDWTQKHIEEHSVGTIQSHFNVGSMKNVPIPLAPLTRQRELVSRLRAESDQSLGIRTALDSQVGLLQERRQALITAAVTGQLDIPEAA